tara:strand:- start:236 stop:877 length:642 start_codon:yes stop_codon:yes gene_type:complete
MSETLSYQDAPEAGLNSEEQESLQIGEQMEQEQQQLLAGKYKSPEDLEKAYLELQTKLGKSSETEEDTEPQQAEEEPETEPETKESTKDEEPQLTQEDVDFLQDMAGGKDGYESMLKWAANTLQQKEIDMYDAVMEQGNPNSVYFAVQALVARYNDATGSDGKLLTGKSSSENSNEFRSQQELVAAMSDPRYDNDPAYRQDVIKRLERSDLQF